MWKSYMHSTESIKWNGQYRNKFLVLIASKCDGNARFCYWLGKLRRPIPDIRYKFLAITSVVAHKFVDSRLNLE